MKINFGKIDIESKETEMIDITENIQKNINDSNLRDGYIIVFVPGSTGAITTIEYESGLQRDFPDMLERISPKSIPYEHEKRWHDGNAHSHVRASLIGPSLVVPFRNSKLTLGTWQQIVFIELDVRPRKRELIVEIVGE
ncbi:MAG: secondary thiamine-phosphate synthase enzyme YjbQ [Candidatus Bathyarchaeota archaeon]|nr:secondary thiamine-phosphate synthase enzyme YjbQ [Candidatus Bathyarchaeota archaeon]MCZ2845378.1 secondary thiamine-phosphate synthase enzyme YjbQ [Candidatus Bathyarchaeota archaeon]